MHQPATDMTVSPPSWRAQSALLPHPLPAGAPPLPATPAATQTSLAVAAGAPRCATPAQEAGSSSCCVWLGIVVILLIAVAAWLVHEESKSWEGY